MGDFLGLCFILQANFKWTCHVVLPRFLTIKIYVAHSFGQVFYILFCLFFLKVKKKIHFVNYILLQYYN